MHDQDDTCNPGMLSRSEALRYSLTPGLKGRRPRIHIHHDDGALILRKSSRLACENVLSSLVCEGNARNYLEIAILGRASLGVSDGTITAALPDVTSSFPRSLPAPRKSTVYAIGELTQTTTSGVGWQVAKRLGSSPLKLAACYAPCIAEQLRTFSRVVGDSTRLWRRRPQTL